LKAALARLAADFDKEAWQENSLAFVATCHKMGVPAYLERSRSGNGGHVWFFFEKTDPDYLAAPGGIVDHPIHMIDANAANRCQQLPLIRVRIWHRVLIRKETVTESAFHLEMSCLSVRTVSGTL
jgi:hypothetical protein